MSENISTSLYDMNKSIIKQLRALSTEQIADKKQEIIDFVKATGNTYYMLLCKEKSYYTLFCKENNKLLIDTIENDVFELLADYGDLHSVYVENDHIEFWVQEDTEQQEMFVFMFFPYDLGVIKCQ